MIIIFIIIIIVARQSLSLSLPEANYFVTVFCTQTHKPTPRLAPWRNKHLAVCCLVSFLSQAYRSGQLFSDSLHTQTILAFAICNTFVIDGDLLRWRFVLKQLGSFARSVSSFLARKGSFLLLELSLALRLASLNGARLATAFTTMIVLRAIKRFPQAGDPSSCVCLAN